MKTIFMVSVINADEARAATQGGAGIIDVKNPLEGALGAPLPGVLAEIKEELGGGIPLSVALGEFPGKPGAAALAALGAAHFRPDYIKVAFLPGAPAQEVRETLTQIRKVVPCALIAGAYADKAKQALWSLEQLTEIAHACAADGCLIDTHDKDGSTLFNHLTEEEIYDFVQACQKRGLLCALAGSVGFSHIPALQRLCPDIVGSRTAVCGGDRLNGRVSAELVRDFGLQLSGQGAGTAPECSR